MVKDLTEGKPEVVLWKFSLPMFISVIFQQMYNIADSIIAGKFAGEEALAAVGASYPITMIFMDGILVVLLSFPNILEQKNISR